MSDLPAGMEHALRVLDDKETDEWRDRIEMRVEALLNAEEIVLLNNRLSRTERACRKATRDAYALVLDMLSEES